MRTEPWTVSIEGEVDHPGVYDIDGLLKLASLEDRVYRLRCVEAWSMVIPWQGYSLAALLKKAGPTSKAKYVEFVRSEEHTSELQSLMRISYAVFCLKNKKTQSIPRTIKYTQ